MKERRRQICGSDANEETANHLLKSEIRKTSTRTWANEGHAEKESEKDRQGRENAE